MTENAKLLDRRSFILGGLATAVFAGSLQTSNSSALADDTTFEPRISGISPIFSVKGSLVSVGSNRLIDIYTNAWPNYEADILDLSGRILRNISPFNTPNIFPVSGGYAECDSAAFVRYNAAFEYMYSVQHSQLRSHGSEPKSHGHSGVQCIEIGAEHFIVVRLSLNSITGRRLITGSVIRNRRVVVRDKILYSGSGRASFYLISAGHVGNGGIGVIYFQTDGSSAEGHRYLITFDGLLRRLRASVRISSKYEYYENGYTQNTFIHPVGAGRFIIAQPNFDYGNFVAHADILLMNQNIQVLRRLRELSLSHYYPTVGTIGLNSIDVGSSIIVAFIRDSSTFYRPGTRISTILKIRKADLKITQRVRSGLLLPGQRLENITSLARLGSRRFSISYMTSDDSTRRKARIFFV